MKHPHDVDNPDVVDERGASPSPLPPYQGSRGDDGVAAWDGTEPLVLKSEAQRNTRIGIAVTAVATGIIWFFVGRSVERDKHVAALARRRSSSVAMGRRVRRR